MTSRTLLFLWTAPAKTALMATLRPIRRSPCASPAEGVSRGEIMSEVASPGMGRVQRQFRTAHASPIWTI